MKLVSINIPTYNSEKTLSLCLKAINDNKAANYEVIIIDGGSTDGTLETAKSFGAKVIEDKEGLLHARYIGVKNSSGDCILLLDSDQIIAEDLLERIEEQIKTFDMLILEETVFKRETLLENLFYLDRKLIHRVKDVNPATSVLLPRVFKKELLQKVFKRIDTEILKKVSGQDHAIIYYEAYKLSQKVGYIDDAVKHMEPESIKKLIKKFYRWGYTSASVIKSPKYAELFKHKEGFRKGTLDIKHPVESIASIMLILLKGIPAYTGRFKYGIDNKQKLS